MLGPWALCCHFSFLAHISSCIGVLWLYSFSCLHWHLKTLERIQFCSYEKSRCLWREKVGYGSCKGKTKIWRKSYSKLCKWMKCHNILCWFATSAIPGSFLSLPLYSLTIFFTFPFPPPGCRERWWIRYCKDIITITTAISFKLNSLLSAYYAPGTILSSYHMFNPHNNPVETC